MLTIAFITTAAVFVGLTLAKLHHQRWARRLPALEALPAPADGVHASALRCSVIVAARDEEARLDATVRHLLAQRDVALEVIVVDDRSTDATSDIMRRLQSEDTRVRAIRVEHLPEGWLGKSHAWSPAGAAITPLLYPVLFFALVNSAVITLRQGGVRWRDTFYPLDTLRRGNVR